MEVTEVLAAAHIPLVLVASGIQLACGLPHMPFQVDRLSNGNSCAGRISQGVSAHRWACAPASHFECCAGDATTDADWV